MKNTFTLKKLFTWLSVIGAALAILFIAALYQVSRTQSDLIKVNQMRYQSYLLADELRQSSDDLTRLARTYAVTGDERYERMYLDILDIRNGKKPRPQHYERIYWDFVAADGSKPQADGQTISLNELMKKAGFSDQEFAKLKEAQDNSDALIKTEVIAMNAVKGVFDDGSGKFEEKGDPNLELARKLVHSAEYHQYKAKIMKPVNEFLGLLDQRTSAAVDNATQASRQAYLAVVLLLGFSLVVAAGALLFTYRRIYRQLGAEPSEAQVIANQIAAGDLAVPINVKPGDQASLIVAMRTMRDSLVAIVGQVHQGTNMIATASAQIASGNQDLSSRTEEQASSLEETASSMEELTSTVRQNADNARQANQLAESASDVAVKGGQVVAQVVETMGAINDSSKKIADITSVIDGIAFQTNILALNAAVEAARAGEQGRGFTVVAAEVRNLAQRSASAAREIKSLIDDSVEKVETGSNLVNEAGATMNEIVSSIKRVRDIMGEITAASSEQSEGIEQVNQAVAQLDQVTQQNATLAEEAAAAAEVLQNQAKNLVDVVSIFKTGDNQAAANQPSVPANAVARPKKPAAMPAVVQDLPAPRKQAVAARQTTGDDWEEF